MLGRGRRTMIRPSNFSSRSTGPGDERAASSRRLSLSHPPFPAFHPRNGERGGPRGVERVSRRLAIQCSQVVSWWIRDCSCGELKRLRLDLIYRGTRGTRFKRCVWGNWILNKKYLGITPLLRCFLISFFFFNISYSVSMHGNLLNYYQIYL